MTGKNDLRPLTPEKGLSIAEMGEYYDALDRVLKNRDIHNIALSGSYGSGKSSILGSYENRHHEKNFIHVTLARFDQPYAKVDTVTASGNDDNGNQAGKTCDNEPDRIVNILEEKILNQVLHQIDPKNIPLSAFHTKAPASKKRVSSVCIYGMCFTLLLLYHLYFQRWSGIVRNLAPGWLTSLLTCTVRPGFQAVAGIVFVGVILLGIVVLLYILQRKNSLQKIFKRIDVKGTVGIELSEDGDESCFDKYLNEVLYLFEHSGATAVVFEDLDRYDVVQIFEKLRVISDLLQQRKEQGIGRGNQDGPIPKFLYLIRDSIFTADERTKFFDLIIPVVPVVAADNAYDMILERVDETKFSKRLLQNISIYVGDMRLINNIFNEYIIYENQVGRTDLHREPDKMLSMMVYKNLFPEDFELLRHRRGYVAWAISQRNTLIARQTKIVDERIEALRQRIKASKDEPLKTLDELNALFFPYNGQVNAIDGKAVEADLTRVELVDKLLGANSATYYDYSSPYFSNGYSRNTKSIEIDSLRQEMEGNPTYQKRREAILDKQIEKQKELLTAMSDLQNQRGKIAISPLSKLLAVEKSAFWKPDNDTMRNMGIRPEILLCPEFPLLQYLLRNGYIDENYAIYISYFYPTSLVPEDKNYLLAVHSHRELGYDYALHDPAAVLALIEPTYFADENIWNLSLFDYLISKENQTAEQRECISAWLAGTKRVANTSEKGFSFILELWKRTQRRDLLTTLINRYDQDWFHLWTDNGSLTDDEWRLFAAYTLTASNDPNMLDAVDKGRWLSNSIAADKGFLMTELPNQSKLHNILLTRSVLLSSLECCQDNLSLADDLYRNNCYQLTPDVLTYLLTTRYGAKQETALSTCYTYLQQKTEEPLSLYVEKNPNTFVDALAASGTRLKDSPEAVLALLNHSKLDKDRKKKYLSLSDTTLKWLNDITDKELWPELLAGDNMEMHWENVADYYCSFEVEDGSLPEPLIDYIEKGGGAFNCSLDDLNQRMGEDRADALLNGLMVCTSFSSSCCQTIWKSIDVIYYSLSTTDLSDQQIEALIATKTVSMTVDNIKLMQTSYPFYMTNFILSDAGEFIKLAVDGSITLKAVELSNLFQTKQLSVRQEEKLLNLFDGTLPVAGKSYHPETIVRVLTEHFDPKEAEWFLLNYNKLDKHIAEAFINWGKDDAASLANATEQGEFIPEDIYAACLDVFTLTQAQRLRQYLPNKDYDRVCTHSASPSFTDKESSRIILMFFQKQGWISSWKTLPNGRLKAFSKRVKRHIAVVG